MPTNATQHWVIQPKYHTSGMKAPLGEHLQGHSGARLELVARELARAIVVDVQFHVQHLGEQHATTDPPIKNHVDKSCRAGRSDSAVNNKTACLSTERRLCTGVQALLLITTLFVYQRNKHPNPAEYIPRRTDDGPRLWRAGRE